MKLEMDVGQCVGTVCGEKEIIQTIMSKRARMSPKPLPRKLAIKEVSRDTFGESICQLRKQLELLFAQDQAVFKQFHEIERTIADLKRQKVDTSSEDESSEDCGEQDVEEEEIRGEGVEDEDRNKTVQSCQTDIAEAEASVCPKVRKPLLAFEGRFIRRDSFGTFHKHVVTFPPSRARCPRLTVVRHREDAPRRPASVDSSRSMSCKDLKMDSISGSSSNYCTSTRCSSPLNTLYRSTSVTVLPRGILVRRAGSCDSGFGGSPSDGEVFV